MNEGKPYKIVNPFSGDYERNRDKHIRYNSHMQSDSCFGVNEIMQALDSNSKNNTEFQFNPYDLVNNPTFISNPKIKEAVVKLKQDLYRKVLNPRYSIAVQTFFSETLSDTGLLKEPATFFSGGGLEPVTIDINKIPDQAFLAMIFSHSLSFFDKTADFRKRERGFRVKLLKQFQKLITDGGFEADFSTIVGKINTVGVHLRDFLAQDKPEVHGEFINHREIVHISIPNDLETENHVYNHEMIHVASGNVTIFPGRIKSDKIDLSGLVRKNGDVVRIKTGLVYIDGINQRLLWLNEAITETLTQLFLANSELKGKIYEQEIVLVEQLLKRGRKVLSKKLFYNAYFEDVTDGEFVHGQIPDSRYLKALFEAVDQAYGKKDFLIKLDDYVRINGLAKAIEALKSNPEQI